MSSAKKTRRITEFFSKTPRPMELSENQDESIANRDCQADDQNFEHVTDGENSDCESDVEECKVPGKRKFVHKFRNDWLKKYEWLEFDETTGAMSCKLCRDCNFKNAFTTMSCKNYRSSTLTRHLKLRDHKNASKSLLLRKDFNVAAETAICQKTASIIAAMRCAYWLCKEGIASMKYSSLVALMKLQGCEEIQSLGVGKNATYTSRETCDQFQDAFVQVIQEDIDLRLKQSVFTSILTDESTDINVSKKLVVYGRIVLENLHQQTVFLGNVGMKGSRATADIIYEHLKEFMNSRGIEMSQISAFGSDGASVMTGKKAGVAKLLKDDSPHCVNIHCLAHRLNLCTSKAADDVEYIGKVFQKTLSELFYYFKKSACRVAELHQIQKLLDDPQLKVKEVHEIRWFAMYSALFTVYQTWRSLVQYFKRIDKKNSKEEQLLTNLTDYKFVAMLHVMMDVIPKFTELSLVFQKVNLDIACVQPAIDGCLSSLKIALSGKSYYQSLMKDKVKVNTGKNNVIVSVTYWGEKLENWDVKESEKIRDKFLNSLQDRVSKRFPKDSTTVATAFSAMGMRSISTLSQEDLEKYGKDEMETLTNFYGSDCTGKEGFVSKAKIDKFATLSEWELVKKVVLKEMYARDSFKNLWTEIYTHHKSMFPNLLTLVRLALIMPLQTADCERGFSCQNSLHSPSRNRLTSDTLNKLMLIKLEGSDISQFDYAKAVEKWKSNTERRVFKS